MYQAIHFDHYSRTCYLRDDEEGWTEFPYQPTYYKLDPKGEFKTLDGKRATATQRYDREALDLYEKDVDKNLSILLEVYQDSDEVAKFQNVAVLDIEIVMGGAINLPMCQAAASKITSIALYDSNTKEFFVYILDEKGKIEIHTKGDTTVIPCNNEESLLIAFLDKWQEIDPTVVLHWNGDGFDIPYLYNRMRRIIGEYKANQLSPIGIVKYDEYDPKMPYKIGGINSLDYLRLYKKFIPKSQPSYKLDLICKAELGKGKIEYTGSLDQLFKDDIDKFIEYNVNDVRLIVELDAKKKFMDLAIMVCHLAHVPYYYVYHSSKVVEGAIMTYLKRLNIVSPNKPTTTFPELKRAWGVQDEDDEKFAGAYVKNPKPGLYGWNGDEDLESMYPNLGIMLNCGIETFLFKIVTEDPFDDTWNLEELKEKDQDRMVFIERIDGRLKEIRIGDLVGLIEENDVIISPNGVAFDSTITSVLCTVMEDWFQKRKEFKDTMKEYGKKGDTEKYDFYDRFQQVMKVFLNSIYGCLGLVSFRYADGKDFIASAITAGGRMTIMNTADFINNKFHIEFEPHLSKPNDWVIMSDTDSAFISAEPILKGNKIDTKDDEKVIPFLKDYFKNLSAEINSWYKPFSKKRFNSDNNRLKIKSELVSKTLYVSAKKQYAQYIVDKEGVKKDEFDFKGLDFMKASYPKLFREFTQGVVKDILFNKPKHNIDEQILKFRETFKTLPMEEVAKPSGLNKPLNDYIGKKPIKGTIFSIPAKGSLAHFKSAIYYNDLLKFKQLDKKHSIIQIGDKIKWCYLKKNPYRLDVLGVSEYDPPHEILNFLIEYMDREAMFDKNLVKKLQKIYDNMDWGTINFNKNTLKFLKFN